MRSARVVCACAVVLSFTVPQAASAQTPDAQALRQEIDQLKQQFQSLQKEYGDRLTALEMKLNAIEGQPAPAAGGGQAAAAGQSPAPAQAGAAQQATAQVPQGAEGGGGPSGALPVYGAGMAV